MIMLVRRVFAAIVLFGTLAASTLLGTIQCQAAKYNYTKSGSCAENISAGTNYDLSNGWVGCPETVYGLQAASIAKDGFAGWGSDTASAYIPVTCNNVGENAFLTINEYNGKKADYLGGVTLPAKFWNRYEQIGFTPYTPLKNSTGEIKCDVSPKAGFVYNGSPQKPACYAVYVDGEAVSYAHEFLTDTINAGVHVVRFPVQDLSTGNFNVSGTFYGSCNYENAPFPLSKSSCKSGVETTYIYSGKAIEPKPVLDGGFGVLKQEKDYQLQYQNNVNVGTAEVSAIPESGNFSGEWKKAFQIEPASLKNVTLQGFMSELPYQGTEIRQKITLTYQEMTLKEGKDYTISYSENKNAGNAIMKISGLGNYQGEIVKNFQITPREVSDTVISEVKDQLFTGTVIEPKPEIRLQEVVLEENKDYTLSYENNRNAGLATILITGKNNLTGSKKISFSILPCDISKTTLEGFQEVVYYTGREIIQEIAILWNNQKLEENIDYRVEYSNHIAAGKAVMAIQGMGNFTGILKKEYVIIPNHADINFDENKANDISANALNKSSIKNDTNLKSPDNQKNTTNITNITNRVKTSTSSKRYLRFQWKKVKKAKKYRVLLKQTFYNKKGKRIVKYKSLCTTKKFSYKKINMVKNRKYTFRFQALSKKGKVIRSIQKTIRFQKTRTVKIRF